MNNFNNLNKKLPTINEYVFIVKKDLSKMRYARLTIYDPMSKDYNLGSEAVKRKGLKNGDVFWRTAMVERSKWSSSSDFPYWIEEKNLINLFMNGVIEESNRWEILDL